MSLVCTSLFLSVSGSGVGSRATYGMSPPFVDFMSRFRSKTGKKVKDMGVMNEKEIEERRKKGRKGWREGNLNPLVSEHSWCFSKLFTSIQDHYCGPEQIGIQRAL